MISAGYTDGRSSFNTFEAAFLLRLGVDGAMVYIGMILGNVILSSFKKKKKKCHASVMYSQTSVVMKKPSSSLRMRVRHFGEENLIIH